MIAPNEMVGHDALISTGANLYVRRRIYLRDQIPYVFVTPLMGGSLFPSMYANLGAELTVGSLGGMNVRAYAGVASGFQWAHPTDGATFPYFGFGVSALDFINRVEETQHEWKDYVRTTMDVNIAEVSVVKPLSSFDSPFGSGGPPLGWDMHLASVEIPMPALDWFLWHDRISGWIGTSLLRWSVVGSGEQAISVLPLRAGYRLPLGSEALMLEPFVELSYYPSQVADVGLKLRNDLKNGMGWGLALGYRTGSAGNFSPAFLSSTWPVDGRSFSTAYLGFQLNVGDWMNDAEVVRDSRAHELPSTIQGTTKP